MRQDDKLVESRDASVQIDAEKRLLPNALIAVLQTVVTAAMLFFLYRYLISILSIEALGVWSLIAAASSLANVSNLGLSGGAVRFVSKYLAWGDADGATRAIETAALSVAAIVGLAILLIWPLSYWLLGVVMEGEWVRVARELLPFMLGALWLNNVGAVLYSGLEGCHRSDLRSLATIATSPVLLILAVWLVPTMGLTGLVWAQSIQYLLWIVAGWILLKRQLPLLPWIRWRWSRLHFSEMWRYGLNFQVISVMTLLSEPVAKGLMSHFGDLASVGYFEMANRLVAQVRGLLVSANQVFVPYYSKLSETSRYAVRAIYVKNVQAIFLISASVFASLIASLPLVSFAWIGRIDPQFILFSTLLSLGWLLNTLAVPAYFANLGGGWINRNVAGQAAQAGAMALIGWIGGKSVGPTAVVVAWAAGLALGGIVVLGLFHRAEAIGIWPMSRSSVLKVVIAGVLISGLGQATTRFGYEALGIIGAIGAFVLVLVAGWVSFYGIAEQLGLSARRIRWAQSVGGDLNQS